MHQATLFQIGAIVILLGFLIIFLGSVSGANKENTKFSVFGLVGFIPFGFSNDRGLFILSVIATILLMVVVPIILYCRHYC